MTDEIRGEGTAQIQGTDLAAFRARQKARNRVLGVILIALAVLFFAITIVKIATPPPKPSAQAAGAEMAH
ncbi:hypothetical protein [Novosphingobium sp. FKTRR1]|uniref:hypothetical protein n=1 Tax=Novosphingobium sp. FKTRR1 TaxID=2879118 RepID=UPI001CEFD271|nr:hypothetical protein [Novosphingobium sp. FKTRR1]